MDMPKTVQDRSTPALAVDAAEAQLRLGLIVDLDAGFGDVVRAPERVVHAGPVEAVMLPGTEGDMTVLPGHAPVMTTLKAGSVVLHSRSDEVIPFADSEDLVRGSGLPASALVEDETADDPWVARAEKTLVDRSRR